MLKLLSRSKHEEFESNQHCRSKTRRKEEKKIQRNFATCEIWFLRELFILQHYSQFCHYSHVLLFDVVPCLFQFLFLPILSLVIAFGFGFFFIISLDSEHCIKLSQALVKEAITSCNKIVAGSFQRSRLFLLLSHFL